MNKPIELRKVILAALLAVHPRVYYEQANDKAAYPYLVFDLPDSVDENHRDVWWLDVDGWDTPPGGDTTVLETLMGSVNDALDRLVVRGELVVMVRLENRLSLKDDDPRIKRRKYIYSVRTFGV